MVFGVSVSGGGVTGWDVVAAVGAGAGVLALLWQIYIWFGSGPKIRVKLVNSFPTYGAQVGNHHFTVSAINHGRAATTVKTWGLRLPDGSDIIARSPISWSDSLPAVLEPQSSASFHIEGEAVIATCKARNIQTRSVKPWVRLATDKEVFAKSKMPFRRKGLPWKG